MYKPALGPHTYKPAATKQTPEPFEQPCVVCAVLDNGTVNLITWDSSGKQSFIGGATLVQTDEMGCPCHYTDPATKDAWAPA